jgi:Tol biopolymer transport system component
VPLTHVDKHQPSHRFPHILPDGRHFLYYVTGGDSAPGVYLGRVDGSQADRLLESDTAAAYEPSSGDVLFVRRGNLFAQKLDLRRLVLDGRALLVAEQVVFDEGSAVAAVSVSRVGSLVYRTGVAGSQWQLIWFDRLGREVSRVGDPDSASPLQPMISPDGRRATVMRTVGGNQDVWIRDLGRGLLSRVTSNAATEAACIWSPDGNRIVFTSDRSGVFDLYQAPSTGGREDLLLATSLNKAPTDWSLDGRFILYRSPAPATGFDVWALPLFGDRKPFPAVQTTFDERDAKFSPDGKWIAYQSNESGRFEIYVQPFPAQSGKVQVSTGGGTQVRWRRDGKEIFYIGLDQRLMAVPIRIDASHQSVEPSAPVPLFVTHIGGALQQGAPMQQYDVSADGKQFLMNTVTEQAALPITVIVNWKPRQ